MLSVLVLKQTLLSVVIEDGEITTVVTTRTSQYRVVLDKLYEVSDVSVTVFCVSVRCSVLRKIDSVTNKKAELSQR